MNKILLICLSVSLVLTSCLKDENIDNQEYGMKGIGSIPLVLFQSKTATTSLDASTKDTSFRLVAVRLAQETPATEDIKVTLIPNNSLVTAGGYSVAPASLYSLDNLVLTIPKGEREGYITITTKTANLQSATYAFGFTITAVSDPKYVISATGKDFLAVLPVKNKYHGTYNAVGYVYHPTVPRAVNMTKSVTTAGANSVIMELGDLGGSGYKAKVTVNETTNLLTIEAAPGAAGAPYTTFTSGLPAPYTAGWTGSSATYNRYDPATRTFYVRYGYMGANGWRVAEEQLTRK